MTFLHDKNASSNTLHNSLVSMPLFSGGGLYALAYEITNHSLIYMKCLLDGLLAIYASLFLIAI